jgi:hypothetical protein
VSDGPLQKRLTSAEVEEVLRRAVEIHNRGEPSGTDVSFSEQDVERIGGEIGVAPAAVRTALVQVRREALMKPQQPPGTIDRFFGPAWIVTSRTVPGPRHEVLGALGSMLAEQLFRVRRNLGETVVWGASEGVFDDFKRAFDFSKRYQLTSADSIVVTVVDAPHPPGWVDVRLEIELTGLRRSKLRGASTGLVMLATSVALAAGLGTASLAFWPLLLGGGGIGSLVVNGARASLHKEAARIRNSAERFLDYLERERVPG